MLHVIQRHFKVGSASLQKNRMHCGLLSVKFMQWQHLARQCMLDCSHLKQQWSCSGWDIRLLIKSLIPASHRVKDRVIALSIIHIIGEVGWSDLCPHWKMMDDHKRGKPWLAFDVMDHATRKWQSPSQPTTNNLSSTNPLTPKFGDS